jgi:predicted enzyme related to lactoylglutathione lyase
MANPFVHVELNTTDVAKAKEFYRKLFDWTLEDVEMGPSDTYTIIKVGEGTGGGLLKNPMPGVPSFWLAYVLVDEIGTATKKAASLGAKVVKDSVEVPNMGWFSIIEDPTGAAVALWQAKEAM